MKSRNHAVLIKARRFHEDHSRKYGKERLELNDALLLMKKKSLNGVFYNKQNTTTYTYTRLHFAPWTLVLEFDQEAMKSFIETKRKK